jgi:glycerol-3-phosphate acyltransferase PlsX
MATVYSQQILKIENPRVGLLNIGSEDKKGNELVRETRRLFEDHPRVNFIGNIEGYDIHRGLCDVAVCEGFMGNVILKVAEGLSSSLLDDVDEALAKRFRRRAMELYGYKKGSMKRALEDTMKKFSTPGRVDWHSIRGALKGTRTSSVQLQHKIWSKLD